jgi:nucleoside-diphosphate-sugar epimerase
MSSNSICIGITGSTGVLGRALLKNWSNLSQNVEFIPFKGDIRNYSDVDQWICNAGKLDGILHLAALVPIAEVDKDPLNAFRVNTLGTLNLLESCRLRFGKEICPWIFTASTSHVYASSSEKQFMTETSTLNPISTYGVTKAQGDQWAEIYRSKYNLPVCTGRIFSYSAPNQTSSFFVPSLVQKIKDAPPNARLEIRGMDGTRDFITVEQIVEAVQLLFTQKSIGVFNIGTGEAVKLFDIAQSVREKLNRTDVTIVSTGTDTHHLAADVKRLNEIGFQALFNMNILLDSFFSDNQTSSIPTINSTPDRDQQQ